MRCGGLKRTPFRTHPDGVPGFHLHRSNRLESLAGALAERLRVPLCSPLAAETVLVQSQGMARWLKLELARRLRSIRPDVPVILMSGYLLGVDNEELRAAGVVQVVQKPFGIHALAEAVSQALGGRPARSRSRRTGQSG